MELENTIKIRKLELINVLRRLKDIAIRLKEPKELYDYLDTMMKNSSDLNILVELLPFDPELKNGKFCLFGHFDELHDRISGQEGSFAEVTKQLKEVTSDTGEVVFKIGVTRYNFFCLDEIVKVYLSLKGNGGNVQFTSFNIFPIDKIIKNFIKYVNEIKEKIKDLNIELILCDDELIEILQLVQFHAHRGKISDKELVRLLGVISEHAFIGPQTIVFDPYHRCNIKCKHCFVHNPLIHHRQEFLDRKFDFDMFKSIIDDAAELKVDGIILQGDGEPLLYNKFFDMLRYTRSKDIGVLFFTNGSLIGEKEAREIVELGIREIYCSFPAGTPQTYKVVTTCGTKEIFQTIVNNLKKLMQIKKQYGKQNPRLVMTHVIHTLNYHELIEMAKLDAEIGTDAARFYLIRLDDNNKHLKLSDEELEVIKRDLPIAACIFKENNIDFVDNIRFQLDHYDDNTGAWSKNIFLEEGCTIGWYFCLIPALYDVSMCCHLRTTGYLTKQSFKELWNSREYRRYRIKAKFLRDNRDFTFPNGVKLYDEHCEHCDNHQTLLTNLENLHKLGLYRFIK
jgi:MoaA/NifB/PqqE/SkfB family radical SAM enzyme